MEIGIPLIGLGLLYFLNKNSKEEQEEGFVSKLPNVDVPNKNYPNEDFNDHELDLTSKLSVTNNFESKKNYLDKFFNPNTQSPYTNDNSSVPVTYQSLDGKSVDSSHFQHNNMVPYFGSSVRTRHTASNTNESVLDNMQGSGSQIFSKKEQGPLFEQQNHLQYAFGAPNQTDFIQSRMNPSMNMNGVKPFQDEKVGPGLGLGYTTAGAGGYNSGMSKREEWLDRGVDELRTANKPKSSGNSLYGFEGAAYSNVTTGVNVNNYGRLEKNHQETAFEMGQNRVLITTGAEKGPTLRSIPIEGFATRPETSTEYAGVASARNPTTYAKGEYMPTHNNEYGEVPLGVANASGRSIATEGDYGIKSKMAYPNNRSVKTKKEDYYGAVGSAVGAVVAPLLDALRPSRRENTIGTLRPYQNAKTTVSNSYVFNPNDKLTTTIREMTEKSINHLNVNSNQNGGAYKVTSQTPVINNRLSTDDFYYSGNAGAGDGIRMKRSYEAEYNQRNNEVKSSTVMGSGYTPSGNMDLLNTNINQTSKPKENDLKNTRSVLPAPVLNYDGPDAFNIGKVHSNSNELYSNIQMDRINPDIMDSIKKNPYTHNILNGL